jgi:multidrug efflux pump subunit AcrB
MAQNPVAANLLMVALIAGGLVMAQNMRKEVFPQIQLDRVSITVPYPGASPAEVEQGIILAVEEAVRPIDGIKEVRSTASEGVASVRLELMVGTDRNKALADVKNAVDRITSLPEEAERPLVSMPEFRPDAISIVVYGELGDRALHALTEQVRDELLSTPGVSEVDISGLPPLELSVEISQETLRRYSLTLPQVAQVIRETAVELPAGGVKTRAGEVLLRTAERRDYGRDFATIPVVTGGDGTAVLLGDIANIHDAFADVDVDATFEGYPAVLMQVSATPDQSPPEVATTVKRYVEGLQKRLPPNVFASTYLDRAELYEQRADLLLRNATLGLSLVLLILGLFLEPKLAFWVTMGIPISFMGSFIILPGLGVSLNMISLFAFIVTLGMVVDDAIVVGENVFRYRREGHPPVRAAILGAKEVATPVFFSIATTVAAFSPLLFIPGVRGKFMIGIPIVVILVLVVSLVESFFVLPAHLAHLRVTPKEKQSRLGRAQERISRGIERFIANYYMPLVQRAVRQRWITVSIAIAIFFSSCGLVVGGRVKTIDFPKEESDWVVVEAKLPFGAPVEETRAVMNRLVDSAKQVIADNGGERINRGIFSMLGVSFMGGADTNNVTSVLLTLVPTTERDISSLEFAEAWREEVGEISGLESLTFESTTGNSGKPIDLEITHRDIDTLERAGQALANKLAAFEGLKDIDNGIELGKPQLDFKMSPEGTSAGLSSVLLAAQVRAAFYGAEALRQQRGRHEVRTMVRLPEEERRSLANVEDLIVRTPAGGEMPLRLAATVDYGHAYTSIRRTDGKRTIRVQADVEEGKANPDEVTQEIFAKVLPDLKARYAGLELARSGRQKDMQDFVSFLKVGFALALLVMYLLLAVPLRSYLQPFLVVMMAIPFGFTGAVLGHLLMGMPMSMVSMMGMVALSGVVVNDSLVLVAAANRFRREQGQDRLTAALSAAHQRFRPVILTSLTTFGGLAPMIFETSVQARVLVPMAVSLGFGVLFSTLVVLLLVPTLFAMVEGLREWTARVLPWLGGSNELVTPETPIATGETR